MTRPLRAPDGAILLPEGLILDADLIWRIWQLCTIKLMNTPLIVAAGE